MKLPITVVGPLKILTSFPILPKGAPTTFMYFLRKLTIAKTFPKVNWKGRGSNNSLQTRQTKERFLGQITCPLDPLP